MNDYKNSCAAKQESLRTRDRSTAERVLHARNEAHLQPVINLQIARAYLMVSDPAAAKRTWQVVMDEVVKLKRGETQIRWAVAIKDHALDGVRGVPLLETLISTRASGLHASQEFIRLGEVAEISIAPGPNMINRENGKRRIVVTANVRGRDLGSFVAEAQQVIDAKIKVPAGYWIAYGGQFEQLISATKRLQIVVPISLLLIFALLFMTFGTVKDTLLVFSGVPLALTGGVAALWLRDIPLSISAGVGFIALSGVAVLNGMVMISFINKLREKGKPLDDAITEGSLTRLRPVLMTALVASLGFVPMALATGTGAEVQRPLATVVIGGILSSTALTLLVLPGLYRMFHRKEDEDEPAPARAPITEPPPSPLPETS